MLQYRNKLKFASSIAEFRSIIKVYMNGSNIIVFYFKFSDCLILIKLKTKRVILSELKDINKVVKI